MTQTKPATIDTTDVDTGARRFRRVAVLKGGASAEREVSLASGAAIAEALRAAGYHVDEVDVTGTDLRLAPEVEAVFIALHGTFGEDGTVQAMLQGRGLPYTGSNAAVSRLTFDKWATKQVLVEHELPTPTYEVVTAPGPCPLPLPVVVKPARQGSSVGIHRVFEVSDWSAALADALQYDAHVLVEAYIDGRELTVGWVAGTLLPVLEIRPVGGYYDYQAKYERDDTEYIVPAPVSPACAQQAQTLAARAIEALGCTGMARVDFRMNNAGDLYILEVNTIPGFTAHSLLPKAAQAAGIDFVALCDRIMAGAENH